MKKCISAVLVLVFLFTMIPNYAIMPTEAASLLSQVQDFNQAEETLPEEGSATEAVATLPSADVSYSPEYAEGLQIVESIDISDAPNTEREVLNTIPVAQGGGSAGGVTQATTSVEKEDQPFYDERSAELQERAAKALAKMEAMEMNSGDWTFWEGPVAEEPAVEEPVAEEPVVEEPVAEEPVAEEPAVEESVEEEPVVEEPAVEEPVAEEPMVEEPVVEEPVVEEPTVEEPVVEEPVVEENRGAMMFMSARPYAVNYTVQGSVYFPAGTVVKQGNRVMFTLYSAPVIENGRIVEDMVDISSGVYTLYAGQTYVSFGVTIAAGDYILGVSFLDGNKNMIQQEYFYTANGGTFNPYLADVIAVNRHISGLTLTLPKAEMSISGRLDFSSCMPTTNKSVYVEAYSTEREAYYEYNLSVPAYTQYINYEIGLPEGTYQLHFSGNFFQSGVYGSGVISNNWEDRSYITGTRSGLNVRAVAPEASADQDQYYQVTVNLASATTIGESYWVRLMGRLPGEKYTMNISTQHVYVRAGARSFTVNLWEPEGAVEEGFDFYIAYGKAAANERYYREKALCLYYSQSLGATGNPNDATKVNNIYTIVINEPQMATITGNISATSENNEEVQAEIYVIADFMEFAYADIVSVAEGTYSISVPVAHLGESFELLTAGTDLDENGFIYNDSVYTLQQYQTINVSAGHYNLYEGTVYLPFEAPDSGVNIEINSDSSYQNYLIAPGEESVEYSFLEPEWFEQAGRFAWVDAYAQTFEPVNMMPSANTDSNGYEDLYFEESVTIDVEASLPAGMVCDRDVTIEFEVYGSGYGSGGYPMSILAGDTQANGKIILPKGSDVYSIRAHIYAGDLPLVTRMQIPFNQVVWEDSSITFTLEQAAMLSGTVVLPSTAWYESGTIRYEVCAESLSGETYSKDCSTTTPFTPQAFAIPVKANESYYLRIYVYHAANSSAEEDRSYYYAGDGQLVRYQSEAIAVTPGTSYSMIMPTGKLVSGTISFPADAFADGDLQVQIRVRDLASYSEEYQNYRVDSVSQSFQYQIVVPSDWTNAILYVNVWEYQNSATGGASGGGGSANGNDDDIYVPVKTNLSMGEYYYSTAGLVCKEADATRIELGTTNNLSFTLLKGTKMTGSLVLPTDFRSDKAISWISLGFNPVDYTRYYSANAFVNAQNQFEAYVPAGASGDYWLSYSAPYNLTSNILAKNYTYREENENQGAISMTPGVEKSGINLAFETGYVISGTVSLPTNAYLPDTTYVNVNLSYGESYAYATLTNAERSASYRIVVPKENPDGVVLQVYVNYWDNRVESPSTNLMDGYFYYGAEGVLTDTNWDISGMKITGDITGKNMTLLTGIPVAVTVTKPADVYEYIRGYAYLATQEMTGTAATFQTVWDGYISLGSNQTSDTYYAVLSEDVAGQSVYAYYYLYNGGGELFEGQNVYVNPDGTATKSMADAQPHTLGTTNTITMPLAKTEDMTNYIKGTISFEEGCVIEEGESYEVSVKAISTTSSNTYHAHTFWADEAKDYEYRISIPQDFGEYYIEVKVYSDEYSNICDEWFYYTSEGVVTQRDDGDYVSLNTSGINITIPKRTTVTGKILLGEDYRQLEDMEYIYLIFREESDSYYDDVYARVDEDNNYYACLPYNTVGNYQFGLRPWSYGKNNLVKSGSNYSEEIVSVEQGDAITGIDIAVETGYTLAGTLRLPNGVAIEEGEISYNLNLDGMYNELYFDSENLTAPFMFGVSKASTQERYLEGGGYYYGDNLGNAYLGDVYYGTDGSVAYDWYDRPYFSVTRDITDLQLQIPTGLLFEFDLDADLVQNESVSGYLYIESKDGEFVESRDFYLNPRSSEDEKKVQMVLPETKIAEEYIVRYHANSGSQGYRIPWAVYLGEDGSFYAEESEAAVYIVGEENLFEITIPKAADVIYPEAILESEHPYAPNMDKTYPMYVHPTEVDGLAVTFSQMTETERNYDYIYIYDGAGNEVGKYSGTGLRGVTITVEGNAFSIRMTSDGSNEKFGFSITDIQPIIYHTVTFKNYDGTVLETQRVLSGSTAEYTELTPVRENEENVAYTFIGWDKSLENITADTEFIAQFKAERTYLESEHPYANNFDNVDNPYTYTHPTEADALRITFSQDSYTERNYDILYIYDGAGKQVGGKYSGYMLRGLSVTVPGNSFSIRLDTDGSNVEFGFRIIEVIPVKDFYTVTFKNYDGAVLDTVTVPAGGSAAYTGATPTRPAYNGMEYEFSGWSQDLTDVYDDLVVYAQFNMAEYVTVTYKNYDGTIFATDYVKKGEGSEFVGVPYRPADENGGYIFKEWSKDLTCVEQNMTAIARFTRKNVVEISTEEELRAIGTDADGVYVLKNDITLTEEWTPVIFEGVLDGKGYAIRNVDIDVTAEEWSDWSETGFFQEMSRAVVRNLTIELATDIDAEETAKDAIFFGGLAGNVIESDIRNVHTTGSVQVDGDINLSIAGVADEVGGSYLDGVSATVDISGTGAMFGIAKEICLSEVQNSYYSGTVSLGEGVNWVTGFGQLDQSSLENCYSNMTVEKDDDAEIRTAVPFADTRRADTINTATDCYYNQDKFAAWDAEDEGVYGTPLTDAEMKNPNSFVGFDFTTIWEIDPEGDGYPSLGAAGGTICDAHEYSDWTRAQDPTCTENGYDTRTCAKCGRVAKRMISAIGHSFGDWAQTKEPDVLSEGERSRVCGTCSYTEVELLEKLPVDLSNPNYGLVHFTVVNANTLAPIKNAQIFISTDNDGENTFYTDENGQVSQFLPVGNVNVSLYAAGCLTRRISINVTSGEQSVPVIGLSDKPLVEAKLSSKVMTYDEIINAGIDVTAPGNNHVVKYNVTLTFGTEKANIVTYFNGNHTCVANTRIPVKLSTGTVHIYPVSEDFYLMVYGEVQWLKEMFDVEMLIMNNSMTDVVTQCTAELELPNGLSLAEMVEGEQTLKQDVPDIGHGKNHSVHWYVRGDVAGEYNIGARLKAVLSPLNDEIDQHYTLEEPIKVYAGNAMHMDIYVPEMTFYGDSYPIRIELTNVSDRTLYNVSNSIKHFKEGKVTHYSNGAFVKEEYFSENTLASIGSSEFKPGDKITIEVEADIEFRSSILRAGINDIKKYVENIDDLLNAYEAYLEGAKTINEAYLEIATLKGQLAEMIQRKGYTGQEADAAEKLLTTVSDFAEVLKQVNNKKAVDLVNKLKTTGVYQTLRMIVQSGNLFESYPIHRVVKMVQTMIAIEKSEQLALEQAVREEELFAMLERAIASIPIKYYLKDVLVSTLQGSTTSIPYSVHVIPTEKRFCSIEKLDKYLDSVIQTAVENLDKPWLMSVLKDGGSLNTETESMTLVKGEALRFAANDTIGDVTFRVWGDGLAISTTNQTGVTENGVLTFVGPGYISVLADQLGSGSLFVQAGNDVKEYQYTVVDAHTCTATEWLTLVSPQAGAVGYKARYCEICDEIMDIQTHQIACDNHIYGEYVTETNANGEDLGIKHRTCTICGRIQYHVIDESIDYMQFVLAPESYMNIAAKTEGEGNYLRQAMAAMTPAQIKSHFENSNIEVELADGSTVTATSKIGTGSKLTIYDAAGNRNSELTVVVRGDVTGEGRISVSDVVQVFNHVNRKPNCALTGDFLEAAYVSDDRRVSILDVVMMFNAVLNEGGILK